MEIRSEVLGNVAISPRQFTTQDGQELTKALKLLGEKGFDIFSPNSQRNSDLLLDYYVAHPEIPVTVATIFKAVEERKSDFEWLTDAQRKWYQAAQANEQLANDLANYVGSTSGRSGQLVKEGDQLFENLLLLFNEINSRNESLTSQSLANAENRIQKRPGPKLKYVAAERRTTPISPAAKEMSDYDPKQQVSALFGDMVKNADGSWRSKTFAEQRADREAKEKAAQPSERERLSAEDKKWRDMATELLGYGTHGNQLAIKQVYDQAISSGLDWRRTYEAVARTVNLFKRSAQMSGWAGR